MMCSGNNYGYDCGCNQGIRRDCYGNVMHVPPPGLPAVPTACVTTNGQLFLSSDKTWLKAQGHLTPVIDRTTTKVGESAIMVAGTIISIIDGLPCDDGHLVQVVATDPARTVSVIVKLIAGGTQTLTLSGVGAFGVQGNNVTFRWVQALNAYAIVESYTGTATSTAKSYYVETHFDRLVPYTIQHNLNLANPSAYILEIRDAATGDVIDISTAQEAANSIRLNPGVTEADVKIKVLALV